MKQQTSMDWLKRIAFSLTIVGLSFFSTSCGGGDDYDCDAAEDRVSDLYDDYSDAYLDGDCDDMEELSDKIIAEFKKAKGCPEVKEAIDDGDYDDFADLLDDIQDSFDDDADSNGC